MKTIVWKELREHGFWVPLALIITSLITLFVMQLQGLLLNQWDLTTVTVFAGAIIASLLGVLQSWGDCRLESRALLLHRSIAAKQAFTAKLLAGLLMHSIATLPPLVVTSLWIAIDGRQTMAAYWDEVLPVMAYTLLAFMCWPASFLVVQRNAWWIGSRLFPLPCAFWILAFTVATTDLSAPIAVRWVGFGLAIFAAGTLFAAAYRAFVSLGRVYGSPRVALGVLHGFSLLVGALFIAGTIQHQPYRHQNLVGTWTSHSVQLGQDGEPVLISVERSGYRTSVSKKAKMSTDGSVLDKLKETDQSHESMQLASWYLAKSPILPSMNGSQLTFRILGTLARRNAEPKQVNGERFRQLNAYSEFVVPPLPAWIYVLDRRSGKILVYSEEKQLVHELTPERATGATRFGELADINSWNATHYPQEALAQVVQPTRGETHLVVAFKDAAYALENDGMTVSRFFDMPNKTLLASSRLGAGVVNQGLRFADQLVLIQPKKESELETTSEIAKDGGVSYFQTTVKLPKQLVDEPVLQIARLPGSTNELVALATKGGDKYLWTRLSIGGEVLEERTYYQPTPSTAPGYRQGPEVWLAALLPVSGFGLFAILASTIGEGLEQFNWDYWSVNPSASIAFCVFLVLQIVVGVSFTYWACRHYRLSKTVTRRWVIASLFGGPFVGLGLMTVYTRVATQTCVACRKKCRADIGKCEHCQQALDQPSRRGIEIFDNERVDAIATVTV
jgi:hypothetical protein